MENTDKKIFLFVILSAAAIFPFFVSADSATIFVDKVGAGCLTPNDSDYDPLSRSCGAGNEIVFNTIQSGVDFAVPGQTINVMGGTYALSSPIIMKNSGELVTTIKGDNVEAVVLDCNNISQRAILFSGSTDADNMIIKNLEIKNCTGEGIVVNTKDNITLDNIESHHNGYPGVWLQNVTNATVQNSSFYNNVASGIWVQGASEDILIQNNTTYDNLYNPAGGGSGDGIDIFNDHTQTNTVFNKRIKILNNTIYGNERQAMKVAKSKYVLVKDNDVYLNGKTGIQIESNVQHVIIDSNVFHDNSSLSSNEIGWWLDEVWYGYVRNNISYNNYTGGGTSQSWYTSAHHNVHYNNKGQRFDAPKTNSRTLYLSDGQNSDMALYDEASPPGSQYNYFANNTSYGDGADDTVIGGFIVIDNGPWAGDNNDPILNNGFVNNIIADRGGANGYEIKIESGNVDAVDLDYNLYYNGINTSRWRWANTYTNFAAYQTESLQDSHSLNSDPLFTDANANDFTLQSGSPAIDAGAFVTVTFGAGSDSTTMAVDNPYWFTDGSDGNGGYLDNGDIIQLEGQSTRATVTGINYDSATLTLSVPLTWSDGQGVAFPYEGSAPDIGAFEYAGDLLDPADVNQDTHVNIKDIQEVIRCIISSQSCNFLARSDVNGDGSVNIKDIQEIIRKIVNPGQ